MIFAARAESRAPNAVALPRLLAAVALAAAVLGLCAPLAPRLLPQVSGQLALLALGAAASALPASVARAAGEMERPLLASLSSACLFAGAAAALLVRGYVTL
jgi:glutamine synthetase